MFSFTTTRPHRADWTPADLIYKYAKENGLKYITTALFSQYLEVNGHGYQYHHYFIDTDGTTDKITVFLALAY